MSGEEYSEQSGAHKLREITQGNSGLLGAGS